MRILLAEDDSMLGKIVKIALENEGNIIDLVTDGELCEAAIASTNFDILVLDINMPKKSGLEILKNLRLRKDQKRLLPVLILTARDLISQKLEGFNLGCDDYLVKPFDLEELNARIKSLTRRSKGNASSVIKVANVELNDLSHQVLKENQVVDFTAKEFLILKILMENAGKVISKTSLEESLYSWEDGLESNALEVYIHNIRKKLSTNFIKTIRGVGYIVEKNV